MMQQHDEERDALRHDQRERQAVARPELSHRCRSPCRARPRGSALKFAMMAEARAIGLVR